MSLEKTASVELGKARAGEAGRSAAGGEGTSYYLRSWAKDAEGRKEEPLKRKAGAQLECKKRSPEGVT